MRHRGCKLLAAVTLKRAKSVTGQTFRVYPAEDVLAVADVTLDQSHVMLAVEFVDVAMGCGARSREFLANVALWC